jgi:tape measure domain-containing protein
MEGGDQGLMPTIDDKVVAMSFESSKFEQGVSRSITAIDRLKAALSFSNASKGLNDINKAAQNNQLGLIGRSVDAILPKLETLRLIGIGVLSQLATAAVRAGFAFAQSLTLGPIIEGFHEYTTNLNAVQTILANTQAAGVGLEDVNEALNTLNLYSDKTIYNFSQMAKNIGTFTAAGVELDVATDAIKGIANLAALSGSNADQASTAMYQLSQALAAGKVTLMDWNSVVNAGMGGTVFQRALANTAVEMGTLSEKAVKLTGPMKNVTIAGESFRNSLSSVGKDGESWLNSKVLTATLAQFTGDLTDAELAAQGFNKEQIKAIQATAKVAMKAATEVKTLGGLLDTTKESIVSGWAETWQIVFGDFEEAKELFTGISGAISGFISKSSEARNSVLEDWKQLGGRTQLIAALKNVFQALGDVIAPIKDAFREIFPAKTGSDLFALTSRFLAFTKSLTPTPETVDLLKRTFKGFFAILSIGKQILGGIFGVFGRLFDVLFEGTGSFLEITAGIGDFLVKVDEALKKGDGLENFFDGLADILETPIKMLGKLKDALGTLFDGFSSGGFSGQMGGISGILANVGEAFSKFLEGFADADKFFQVVLDSFVTIAEEFGPALAEAFSNMNFEAILAVVRTGLVAGIFLIFKKFLGRGTFANQLSGMGGGIIKNISGAFDALRGSMVAMQQNIQADTLRKIAIAIGILAASVVALSFVDPEKLKSSLTAMTVAFGQLLGAMAILTLITKTGGFLKIPFIAASLILLAGAILLLTASVVVLSMLSWEELLKGLVGVGVLLGVISIAAIPLSANSGGMIRAGIGITAIATGLLILSYAVKSFADMNWSEMGKGLLGVAIGLGILVAATLLMPPNMFLTGAGLVAIAIALRLLADSILEFGGMDFATMGKGMLGIGGALVVIAGAMRLMPGNLILIGAGLILVAIALGQVSDVIQQMGGMDIRTLAQGLGALAAALIILGTALYFMAGTISGAIALGIAAVGIKVLAGALEQLGNLSWQQILTGLITLAAAFAVIGIAGALIAPAILPLLGLGAAMLLIGGGLALAGLGISLISAGLSALIVALPTGVGVLLKAMTEFSKGVIENAHLIILGLLEIIEGIAKVAPKFVDAFIKILKSILEAIPEIMPDLIEAVSTIVQGMIQFLTENQDELLQAGFDLLLALLRGIRNNIGEITTIVADIIVEFINSLAANIGQITTAGVNLLIRFIAGIGNNIGRIVTAGANLVIKLIQGIVNNYGRIISAGANAIIKFVAGIGNNVGKVVTAGVTTVIKFIEGLAKNAVRLANAAGRIILQFLNGLEKAIDTYSPQITEAAIDIGVSIIAGIIEGLGNKVQDLYNYVQEIAENALDKLRKPWKLFSPSKVTRQMGQNLIQGLVLGIQDTSPQVIDAVDTMSKSVMTMMSSIVLDEFDINPTITPILDLTQVQTQAQKLAALTNVAPITAAVSLNAASRISPVQLGDETAAAVGGSVFSFEQNNYSPKALTEVEIYRQTKNGLSQIKSALAVT